MKKLVFVSVAAFGCLNLMAADIVWTGDINDVWNRPGEANWTNAQGVACTFANGDNVYFSDRLSAVTEVSTGDKTLNPGAVVFDVDERFSLNFSGVAGLRSNTGSFVKRGPGVLVLTRDTGFNGSICGIDIENGRIETPIRNAGKNYIFGDLSQNPEIRVSSGAELRIYESGAFAPIETTDRTGSGSFVLGGKIILNGGLFSMCSSQIGQSHSANAICDLVFNNGGTLNISAIGASGEDYGVLRVADTVAVTGVGTPSIICSDAAHQKLLLDFEHPTEFHVDDVSGDDGVDLSFPLQFANVEMAGFAYKYGAFRKTGPGTMQILVKSQGYRSDVEIGEGTLVLDRDYNCGNVTTSPLGNLSLPDRCIVVTNTGTLYVDERGMLDRSVTGEGFLTPITVVDGGTLKVSARGTPNVFGPLVFDDGVFDYAGGRPGVVGMVGANGTVKITGTHPAIWPAVDLGYWFLLPDYATVFDVADITRNGDVDFDFGLYFTLPYKTDAVAEDCGFTKMGPGTMRIGANHENIVYKNSQMEHADYLGFLGEARVNAGTLQVDGSIASNLVKVASGAYLSGTGTVGRVIVAGGGGFAPRIGQEKPLEILGDLAVPATGVVDLQVADPSADGKYKVDFARVGGTISGEPNPFAGWTVKVNGEPTDGRIVLKTGNILSCVVGKGLVLIVR